MTGVWVRICDASDATSWPFTHAAARLGVRFDELSADEHLVSSGIGSRRVSTVRHAFEAVSVGDLTFSNMKLDVLKDSAGADGVEMILGADFQRKVHLWISYSSHSLIMQYPPKPSKKPE